MEKLRLPEGVVRFDSKELGTSGSVFPRMLVPPPSPYGSLDPASVAADVIFIQSKGKGLLNLVRALD
ncbi:unnamed protein product [Dovyalis caffra]|uniref:Uncharacterized protein n=1 Tax=Dovyalis caffra TaxID=77055 RepID=A0AAV1RSJ1_9ROSI|nr:unnamed protein product [Dovyalis caffra]